MRNDPDRHLTFDPGRGFTVGGMNEYRISEAAKATGFSVSALRFYEKEGVVVPDRSESDYRLYADHHLDSLRFVRRGKQLGLSLDEVKELLELLKDEDCAPVQSRIKELVSDRISQAQAQIAELVGFTSQLQDVQARLSSHTAEGSCDDHCGCRTDPVTHERREPEPIPLMGADSGDIACSLDPDRVGGRVEDWNRILSASASRSAIPGGVRVHFHDDVDIAALARLAAAEHHCCSFFRFGIAVGPDGVSLDVTGPEEARDVIASVFGKAA